MKKIILFIILSWMTACSRIPAGTTGPQAYEKGRELFIKAREHGYNEQYFQQSRRYLLYAKEKGVEKPGMYFMLGTIYNIIDRRWDQSIYYLDKARIAFQEEKKFPIEYWKTLYNLSKSLLHSDNPNAIGLAAQHLKTIVKQKSLPEDRYSLQERAVFSKLLRFARSDLEKM